MVNFIVIYAVLHKYYYKQDFYIEYLNQSLGFIPTSSVLCLITNAVQHAFPTTVTYTAVKHASVTTVT